MTFTFSASMLKDVPFMYGLRDGNAVYAMCPSSLQDVARAARRCESCRTPCCFPDESTENTACGGHVPTRAGYTASRTWRFCSEAGILQLSQWQSPVASLHLVN